MKKKKRGFQIEKEFSLALDFIKEIKNFIWVVSGIFIFFAILGFFIPLPEEIATELLKYFEELVMQTQGYGELEMVLFLFNNNVIVAFFGVVLGTFFGIFPFVNSIINGFVLGYAARIATNEVGIWVLWRLFPHGIFELPALVISLALGLKISTFIVQKNKSKAFQEYFWKGMKVFILIVVPLLVIAAIIEGLLIVWGV